MGGIELVSIGGMAMLLLVPLFMQWPPTAEGALHGSMPREEAFPAPCWPMAGMSKVIWGKTVKAFAFHLAFEEYSARWPGSM
jgi:hypothetical protein